MAVFPYSIERLHPTPIMRAFANWLVKCQVHGSLKQPFLVEFH
jgi:hypothetical protein